MLNLSASRDEPAIDEDARSAPRVVAWRMGCGSPLRSPELDDPGDEGGGASRRQFTFPRTQSECPGGHTDRLRGDPLRRGFGEGLTKDHTLGNFEAGQTRLTPRLQFLRRGLGARP